MQIRCQRCTKTLLLPADGALPAQCPHCAAAPGPGPLGAYEPVRLLAAGGMGEVYLARHRELGTEVAIKLLPPLPLDQLPALRERFAREARLTAQVPHPGVVQVLASETAGDRPFLVLELVRGRTLRARLVDGPLPVAEALRLAIATADVLAAAHAHGVLHRDVKPDNVMVQDDGAVRVLDFGIARAIADEAPLTRTGELVGTPEYMAPEQLLEGPEAIDARTDVHALSVLTYELLTGRSPFRGSSLFQALKLVVSLNPPPPSSLRAEVPAAVVAVVRRALPKDPPQRPADAGAFAAELRAALPQHGAPRPRRAVWLAFAALGGLLAIAWWSQVRHGGPVAVPAVAAPTIAEQQALERHEIAALLAAGRWTRALHRAERLLAAGDAAARPLAQQAFVRHHTACPQWLGLPAWLGACDEAQRGRLFVDDVERVRDVERARGGDTSLPDGLAPLPPEQLAAQLPVCLRVAAGGDEALAEALLAHAQRLPIDEPEHWLAQLVVRQRRGDGVGREQAAEQAWLCGAGELAVLLDAGSAVLPRGEVVALVRSPDANLLRRLRRRVLAAIGDDAPAAVLLATARVAIADETQDLAALRRVPRPLVGTARSWLLATAAADAGARDALLLAATALGEVPDYTQAPWAAVPPHRRRALDDEVRRGR
ncbi:MAG: protein kinase domain-containing protein [Planctomycetota bacterium]